LGHHRFDVLTAPSGSGWYESLGSAIFAESPLAAVLTAMAIWSAMRGTEN
jgi:hypothetical protein